MKTVLKKLEPFVSPVMQLLIWAIMFSALGIAIWALQDSIFSGASAMSAMWSLYTFFTAKWVYDEVRRVVAMSLVEDEDDDWAAGWPWSETPQPDEDEQA